MCCIVLSANVFGANDLQSSLHLSLHIFFFFFSSDQFSSMFYEPFYAAILNSGSSAKSFSSRWLSSPAVGAAQSAESVVGKGRMVGSVAPGIWGSGLRGRVTPTSGPATGTSGKEGMVTGWPRAGSTLTVPSGWSWAVVSCS